MYMFILHPPIHPFCAGLTSFPCWGSPEAPSQAGVGVGGGAVWGVGGHGAMSESVGWCRTEPMALGGSGLFLFFVQPPKGSSRKNVAES